MRVTFVVFVFVFVFVFVLDYHVLKENGISWSDAEDYCNNNYGTNLVSIHNGDENEMIFSLLSTPANTLIFAWIGLNDQVTDGTFEWSDGTSFNSNNYQEWNLGTGEGESNNPSENCVSYYTNGYWIDINCDITAINHFICNGVTCMFFFCLRFCILFEGEMAGC